jgi:hypothetical protein
MPGNECCKDVIQERRNIVEAELMQSSDEQNGLSTNRETLYLLGGVAMIVFGAGLVLSNPVVRRYIGKLGLGGLTAAALPDMERYWKLRNM